MGMVAKRVSRLRRARKARHAIQRARVPRLCVFRTPKHIYAQVIDVTGGKVMVSASTLDKELRSQLEGHFGNVAAAKVVGKYVAMRAVSAGITKVAFDRSGFKYHGRVMALAEMAREHGLKF